MSRLLAIAAFAALLAAPCFAQTMSSPAPAQAPQQHQNQATTQTGHQTRTAASGSSMRPKQDRSGDNSADQLNRQELQSLNNNR